MNDVIGSALAVFGAVTTAFTGNQGGVVLAFLLILGLGWKLRSCDRKHDQVLAQNHRLSIACVQLIADANARAGREVVSSAAIEEILAGKPAVKYAERRAPGRRKNEKGTSDGETEPAGGPGDVSA
jgi:hypothetical protein